MIADLGLSKQITEIKSNSLVFGMAAYTEPQCYKKPGYKRDKRSDIYSLGILFWEITRGHPPFLNYSLEEIINYITQGIREDPVKDTPSEYQLLYQKCWDEDPESRPDIDEIHEILKSLLSLSNTDNPDSNINKLTKSDSNIINSETFYSDSLKFNY